MADGINERVLPLLKKELAQYRPKQIEATLSLLAEGNTVPFIARYRKEMTHGLDEEQILYIQKEYKYFGYL